MKHLSERLLDAPTPPMPVEADQLDPAALAGFYDWTI